MSALLTDFLPERYHLDIKNAFAFVPHRMSLTVRNRPSNALIYVNRGAMKYHTEGGEFTVRPGNLIYIPEGSFHKYVILTPDTECLEVDFAVSGTDGKSYSLSEYAVPFLDDGEKYLHLINAIISDYSPVSVNLKLKCLSALYELMSDLVGNFPCSDTGTVRKKLVPALNYIETHSSEDICIEKLAEMCFMSESHFRRLFKAEMGVSPLKYKTNLRMKKAADLLSAGTLNVGEISFVLGFENIYYFSKMFKQVYGVTPTDYKKTH